MFRNAMIKPENNRKPKDVSRPTFAFAATEVSISTKSEDYLLVMGMVGRYKKTGFP